jgi:Ser/Thr protein kinase RdoA (MazF antagonist)
MENWFKKRILYDGPIDSLMEDICDRYEIGSYESHSVIRKGYQDLNFKLETDEDKYFVKAFTKTKSDEDCRKYVDIMEEAVEKGIRFTQLLKSGGSALQFIEMGDIEVRLCVMEFIEGSTFDELDRGPEKEEIEFVARQASLINSMEAEPHGKWDSWSVSNFLYEFRKCSSFLEEEDKELIKPLVSKFRKVDVESLPHRFVHNDLRETNIMKDKNGDLWVLDFGVSDIYPRIQEIAVTSASFLNTGKMKETKRNQEIFLKEYKRSNSLTKREKELRGLFTDVAAAMEVIRPTFEKKAKGNQTEENEYWLRKGRKKLRRKAKIEGYNIGPEQKDENDSRLT